MKTRTVVRTFFTVVALSAAAAPGSAQTRLANQAPIFQQAIPVSELAARRAELMRRIGDGVAIVEGATGLPAEARFRQNNRTFYLCGIEVPRVILVVDGRSHRSVAYIPPDYRSRAFGPSVSPGEEGARVTGLDAVLPREEFTKALAEIVRDGRVVWAPHDPQILGSGSRGEGVGLARANREDPWDARPSLEEVFIGHLKAAGVREVKDVSPLIREMRAIKTPAEIAVIRRATNATGLALMEIMRDARPGMYEYELQADALFVFKQFGAQGDAYFPLIASGTNTLYTHYHFDDAKLKDGDLVQVDYAPDLSYYVSDLTRVFPANGKFTARQRELYSIYLKLYKAVESSMQVHVAPRDIMKRAVVKMDSIMAVFPFTDPTIEDAAKRFADRYRNSRSNELGHTVGVEVHDVPRGTETLEPGQIFTIEPQMTIPDEHIGLRLEDMFLVTDSGVENMSAWVPIEIDDIEALMAQPGLSDAAIHLRGRSIRE